MTKTSTFDILGVDRKSSVFSRRLTNGSGMPASLFNLELIQGDGDINELFGMVEKMLG